MKIIDHFLAFQFWQIFFLDVNETNFGDESKNKLEHLFLPGHQQVKH